jgi:hypothetical protein
MPDTLSSTLTTGLRTEEQTERGPYGFRVSWINWDSGFRHSGLRIGDLILGVANLDYSPPEKGQARAVGQPMEDQHLRSLDFRHEDGGELVFRIKRGTERLEIKGQVRFERSYTDAQGRRSMSPEGPDRIARDGFDSVWSSWYENIVPRMRGILDGGWRTRSLYTRVQLPMILAEQARIDYLTKNHAGAFATAMREDWERTVESLRGRRYELTDEDVAWKRLGEERVAEISALGAKAREAMLAKLKPETIEPFPTIDPIRGDRASVAGKVVVLPNITKREWVAEGGRIWFSFGDARRGHYFMSLRSPAAGRMFDAQYRYQLAVSPRVPEGHLIIGRISSDPAMLVVNDKAITGLQIEPLAATVGDRFFVDLTSPNEQGESFYIGEEALMRVEPVVVPDTASPAEVIAAYYRCLQTGMQQASEKLFTSWHAARDTTRPRYDPGWGAPSHRLMQQFNDGRRRMLEKVEAVRVVGTGEVEVIVKGDEFPGATLIEEVDVEVDHIGLFDGEHRAFCDGFLCRVWWLQRREKGPWRIAHVANTLGA